MAGDFKKGRSNRFDRGVLHIFQDGKFFPAKIDGGQILAIDTATEENVKKMAGTLGWGATGAVLLGPVGAVVGALAGGNKKTVTFICALADGRKFLGEADANTYKQMSAQMFENNLKKERGIDPAAPPPKKEATPTGIKILLIAIIIMGIMIFVADGGK
ncbi:MAG: hypothetical protein LBE32_05510 [Burkholderiales bacterium]|nr:hypothetical protein [Burkholderiales bacterium]